MWAAELSSYAGRVGDVAHGLVEGQAQDLDEEVDGVAGPMARLRLASASSFLENKARKAGSVKLPRPFSDQLESP